MHYITGHTQKSGGGCLDLEKLKKQKNDFLYQLIHYIKGQTQKCGAVLIVFTIKTAPFFCVCPVLYTTLSYVSACHKPSSGGQSEAHKTQHVTTEHTKLQHPCGTAHRMSKAFCNVHFVSYDLLHILLSCDKIMDPWNVYMYICMYVYMYVQDQTVNNF
jgi:hypothetical protein